VALETPVDASDENPDQIMASRDMMATEHRRDATQLACRIRVFPGFRKVGVEGGSTRVSQSLYMLHLSQKLGRKREFHVCSSKRL
jgi:hypothetical protein